MASPHQGADRPALRGAARVDLRTLTDLHARFLITDTTAMNGSANLTQASADRASEVATFFSAPLPLKPGLPGVR